MKKNQRYAAESIVGRRLDPNLRRAQLLEHAISAFADAGIERAAHADVAARANVSTPTVFKYFPSREVLVDAVLTEVEQTFEGMKSQLIAEAITTPQMIRAIAATLSNLCTRRPDLMKVALTWSVAFTPIRARYLSFENRLLDILPTTYNAIILSEADKRIIYATANTIIRMHFDGTDTAVRQDFIERVCELMDRKIPEDETLFSKVANR